MSHGRLLHAILERLIESPLKLDLTDNAISELIDDARSAIDLKIADERLWNQKKLNYLRIVKSFIQFELEWRKKFPKTQTVARELQVSGELSLNSELRIPITGKIDRVDKAGD